jgi:bacterioferritin
MKGDGKVIQVLNEALSSEVQAIMQYMLHAELQANWGLGKLSAATKREAIEEMKHAERLMERIVFLEGTPKLGLAVDVVPGKDAREQLEENLKLELEAVAKYSDAVDLCQKVGDTGSRELFEDLLQDEEGHVNYLESQLSLIDLAGYQNWIISLSSAS